MSDAALAYLRQRFGPDARITVMRPGEWSAAYAVRTADADLVARFSAYDEDFERRMPTPPPSAPKSDGRTRRIRVSSSPSMCSLVTRSAAA